MKVIKIGGGSLKGKKAIDDILDLVAARGKGHIVVVSALSGVTDMLIAGIEKACREEAGIAEIITDLRNRHKLVADYLIPRGPFSRKYSVSLLGSLSEVERLYYGLCYTREVTPRLTDMISSYGERLCADLLVCALRSRGVKSTCLMPHKIGLITDGVFGDASALLPRTSRNFQRSLKPLLGRGMIVFIPGFFGVAENGEITTFGRGGSDYSAAVVAAAIGAEILEVWKDVPGYMSADPGFVPDAKLIPVLSYDEAAELSYFGAKILHPRTVEPLRKKRLDIAVKNTLDPDAPGSLITSRARSTGSFVKSVAHDKDIAILKVHASGVGAQPGVLARASGVLTGNGINIKSVVTSQTCISFLIARKDLQNGYSALSGLRPRPYRRLEKLEDVALVGIVGQGLSRRKGVAALCFSAVAERGVNVEMISFGPSPEALYFIVRNRDLKEAVRAIHDKFFP